MERQSRRCRAPWFERPWMEVPFPAGYVIETERLVSTLESECP